MNDLNLVKDRLPKDYHKRIGKIKRFIADLFLPYKWSYHTGYLEGAKKQRYFEGMADGQVETHEFYRRHVLPKIKKYKI